MRICITSQGDNLDAFLDPRFGRCNYFIIVDSETMEFEALPNPSLSARGGAGIEAAQTVLNKGVDVLITGDVGPNASKVLSTSNIKIITTKENGTVREILDKFLNGKLG